MFLRMFGCLGWDSEAGTPITGCGWALTGCGSEWVGVELSGKSSTSSSGRGHVLHAAQLMFGKVTPQSPQMGEPS